MYFSPSWYEVYERCEQEGVYSYQHKLQPSDKARSPFFGNVLHTGLRAFYEGAPLETILAVAENYWQAHAPVFSEYDKPHLTLDYAKAILRLYTVVYPVAAWGFTVVLNERLVQAGEEGAIVDRVIRRHLDNQLYAMDTKSSGLFPTQDLIRSYAHNQQAAMQIDLASAHLKEPIAGFIYDGIFLTKRKEGPNEKDFLRSMPIPYSVGLRQELAKQREAKRVRIRALQSVPGDAEKRTKACFRLNETCPFLRYCSADVDVRQDLIDLDLAVGVMTEHLPKKSPAT